MNFAILAVLSHDLAVLMTSSFSMMFWKRVLIIWPHIKLVTFGKHQTSPSKYRQRRLAADPLKLLALEENWNPHFEALEAGCVVAPEQLVEEAACTHVQERAHMPPSVGDLPTLFDLEHTLRANKVGRATGYDPITSAMYHHHAAELAEHAFPLMVKMWVWGEEPLQYKGGPMALIPKRPHPSAVHHFRGILLLPTLAKSFHALLRKRIMGS